MTYEQALARVKVLNRQGLWPGIRKAGEGTYELTHDPDRPEPAEEAERAAR